jgi:predicted enzyme related to lactoylglutathione lyase
LIGRQTKRAGPLNGGYTVRKELPVAAAWRSDGRPINVARMKTTLFTASIMLGTILSAADSAAPAGTPLFRAHGIRINIADMDQGMRFYCETLGFAVESRAHYPLSLNLKTDPRPYCHIKLVKTYRSEEAPTATKPSGTSFTLHINDIHAALGRIAKQGVKVAGNQVRIEQVGLAFSIVDPWGATVSMMDLSKKPDPLPPEPRIYNYGLVIPMDGYARAREFWCDKLGFMTLFDRFLPLDQALFNADKGFGFMIHMREGVQVMKGSYPGNPQPIIQLATPDLDAAIAKLRAAGAELLIEDYATDDECRRFTAFREPFGVPVEVIEIK